MQKPIPYLEKPFVHPQATVIGNVVLGENVSIWPGSVIRADLNTIQIGNYTNIQDNCTLHTDSNSSIQIGDWTLVGHNAILHGCKIGKACLIGIASIILDGAEIGNGSQITAGCIIRGGKKIPPRSLVIAKNGDIQILPGKAKPELTIAGCIEYVLLAQRFLKNEFSSFSEKEEKELIQMGKDILNELQI